jgi:SAM-dependent methyltransferase
VTEHHELRNRQFWDDDADDYQAVHRDQLAGGARWGVWAIPESQLDVLGDVRGLDVLELGCGGAQWSIALRKAGASAAGLDQSRHQLAHARRDSTGASIEFPLVCASGTATPFRARSFDLVFCDHGALSFCDPEIALAECARILRIDGRLVFNHATLLHTLCWNEKKDRHMAKLQRPYFGARKFDSVEGTVDFHLPYGDWIRAFRRHGFAIEDLVELQPPSAASTTYDEFVDAEWATRWPAEEIWVLRRSA